MSSSTHCTRQARHLSILALREEVVHVKTAWCCGNAPREVCKEAQKREC